MKRTLTIILVLFTFAPIFYFLFKPVETQPAISLQQGYYNLLGKYVGLEKPKIAGIYSLVQDKKAKKVIIPPEANP